ncbi:MAG: carboxypeptidase-like regulatory domain-containing protein [Chloroflexota bacterium]
MSHNRLQQILAKFVIVFLVLLAACLPGEEDVITKTPLDPSQVATVSPPVTWMVGDLGWGTVAGRVYDSTTENAVSGARVVCEHYSVSSSARCSGEMTTSDNGRFLFEDIFFHDTDHLIIRVNAPGYQTETFRQDFFIRPGLSIDIALTSLEVSPAPLLHTAAVSIR